MSSDEFMALALRVTEGSATPAERARFEAAMTARPEHREAWLALRRELQAAREAAADAADLAGPVESLPVAQRERLLGRAGPSPVVRPWGRWLAGAAAVAACVGAVLWFGPTAGRHQVDLDPAASRVAFVVPTDGPITIEGPRRSLTTALPAPLIGDETVTIPAGRSALLLAADGTVTTLRGRAEAKSFSAQTGGAVRPWFAAPLALLASSPALTRGGESLRILSPRGATALPEPEVAWVAEVGRTYVVELQDALQPAARPVRVEGAVSPLAFGRLGAAPLVPGGIYVLTVTETGRPASATRVRFMAVAAEAKLDAGQGPAAVVAAAFRALTASPARTGDAWLWLEKLPADWRESELGRRLAVALNEP